MPNYKRFRVSGGSYFFTVNLKNRNKNLLVENIDVLREAVREIRTRYPFKIDACVILPDHFHCVWTLPEGDSDFSLRLRLLKTAFSKTVPKTRSSSFIRNGRKEAGIWQRRFWEHGIRDQSDFNAHIDYVHINPVKHGLVSRVKDWPYSTFHRYVEEGVLPIDWGGDVEMDIGAAGE
ncbi:transposase [Pseudomaricurvus alkylphenolicus]|uniref:REP-associated tyrosine transposase n=1 Tax=Pseudomaricurvus alkylphenolicus TaxID=1306991 RepID=UPI0014202DF7|nr:transposase [Pseudomaricurvus alkylphenolicus]NIB38589.1 transposase [Pseudomaricurvus alkylphenolicus]